MVNLHLGSPKLNFMLSQINPQSEHLVGPNAGALDLFKIANLVSVQGESKGTGLRLSVPLPEAVP